MLSVGVARRRRGKAESAFVKNYGGQEMKSAANEIGGYTLTATSGRLRWWRFPPSLRTGS